LIAAWTLDPDHRHRRLPMRIAEPLLTVDDSLVAAARARTVDHLAAATTAGLPPLGANGNLPAGVHAASLGEFLTRFGGTERRDELLDQVGPALRSLHRAGIEHVVVGGSLVGAKPRPGDVDLAWLPNAGTTEDTASDALRRVKILVPNVSAHRADRVVENARSVAGATVGETFLELLQHDRGGKARGVVLLSTADALPGLAAAEATPALRGSIVRRALEAARALTPA
jgi:hypothetical protein